MADPGDLERLAEKMDAVGKPKAAEMLREEAKNQREGVPMCPACGWSHVPPCGK